MMNREILIHACHGRLMGALVEEGHLCEYWVQNENEAVGQVIKGRVERIVPGMKAAFVNIGQEKNGFLPLDEGGGALPLQCGQEILVQIKKAAQGTKGAFLTREISLSGNALLYLPLTPKIGVSKRITDEEQRDALYALGSALAQPGTGIVMRSNALSMSEEEIVEELQELKEKWHQIVRRSGQFNAPAQMSQNSTHLHRLLKDYAGRINQLVTDDEETLRTFEPFVQCQRYDGDTDLFVLYGISKQVEEALHSKVWLKSGGYLIIDACEALTAIDVNTGKFTGKKLLEETLFKLNLEACQTIARQIRLRGLAGILIIDFIDMADEAHRQQVVEALSQAFSEDRQKTVIHGFTSLGLMEMTRKKDQMPLGQRLTLPCPQCHGTGYIKGEDVRDA